MTSPDWPSLPFDEWEATCDTVHMWTQIVGKTRLGLEPLLNHWWNVPLYVTPYGLTTSSIPHGREAFEIQFDFIDHVLALRTSGGLGLSMRLYPRSVADFYGEYRSMLAGAGIEAKIHPVPVEFDDTTPFDKDTHHASYDKNAVERFRKILVGSDRILKRFRASFLGKSSPVHFFWGSFDLAVTRFSGRTAPERSGVDPIAKEAYSHEVISCGFWPGDRRFKHPAFYAYAAPSPEGLSGDAVKPDAAYWDTGLSEFVLKYEDMRIGEDPDGMLLDFCESTYDAAANRAGWDRESLDRRAK